MDKLPGFNAVTAIIGILVSVELGKKVKKALF